MSDESFLASKRMLVNGTRELFGEDCLRFKALCNTIEAIFKRFGFLPFESPAIVTKETFTGFHGAGEELLFNIKSRNGENLVLRYDLTVPFARYAAEHKSIERPLKRYQIQQAYRDDNVDKGHFREFYQCDADIIGPKSLIYDAIMIDMAYEGLTELGFKDFIIRVNHRMFFEVISKLTNLPKVNIQRVFDAVDKSHKGAFWLDEVKNDLKNHGINVSQILPLLSVADYDVDEALSLLEKNIETTNEGITELKEIFSLIGKETKKHCRIDLTLARGADYYTGTIFEGVISNSGVGAVLGGGRYDKMLHDFDHSLSDGAVGFSFGLDRIAVAYKSLKQEPFTMPKIIAIDGNNKQAIMKKARELRSKGEYVDIAKFNPKIHSDYIFLE